MSNLGYFGDGDRIQLTDPKGKLYSFTIAAGKEWHTHKGWITHDELIGLPEGSVVSTTGGLKFTAFKPLLADYVLTMPRGATIVYPKDAAMIVGLADIYPGARVLEAGVGSGALTISLLRACGSDGSVHSVERRADFADNARSNVDNYFGGSPNNWTLTVGDLQDQELEASYDRVILDMLAPWECVDIAARALRPGECSWPMLLHPLSFLLRPKQSRVMVDSQNLKAVRLWYEAGTMRAWLFAPSNA